jgi:hypothetical protein
MRDTKLFCGVAEFAQLSGLPLAAILYLCETDQLSHVCIGRDCYINVGVATKQLEMRRLDFSDYHGEGDDAAQ